jgi:hypothetical protein
MGENVEIERLRMAYAQIFRNSSVLNIEMIVLEMLELVYHRFSCSMESNLAGVRAHIDAGMHLQESSVSGVKMSL